MIEAAEMSTIFLLDTESTGAHRERNRPALIQLQMNPTTGLPPILLVETNYLPTINSNEFSLIKELFRIVLDSNNTIYSWGEIRELNEFVQFNLFTINQIHRAKNENLQELFKLYWQQCHPHTIGSDCQCEICIGKAPSSMWSLQDAVGHQINEWLDKRYTCSPFDIGLDPALDQFNEEQLQERLILATYAANDVLSMEKLLISMQEQLPELQTNLVDEEIPPNYQIDGQRIGVSPTIDELERSRPSEQDEQEQSKREPEGSPHGPWLEQNNGNESHEDEERKRSSIGQQNRSFLYSAPAQRQEESIGIPRFKYEANQIDITKKKHRNRICTIKQRIRNYRDEIIRRGIDPRFSISMVKEILRRYEVPYTALNISKSSSTGRTSLYIGIRNKAMLKEYESRTRELFTTDYFNEFSARNHIRRKRVEHTRQIR